MAQRRGLPHQDPEAEPVLVQATGRVVVLTLDDGQTLTFDRSELRATLEQAA
jgi:hypothetical protein